MDLREGKDWPQNLGHKEFDNIGKTTGILLQLTKPVWSTGKVFVLDNGFCVLQAIVEIKKRGLFAVALIKKRRYWPKYVPCNEIIAHFNNKDVGDINAIKGTMDGVPFHIHVMKEPDYIMMLMSTYGMTLRMGVTKRWHYTVEGVKKVVEFQYPEIVHNHYKFCDMIDNHNSFQMHPISMEETWMTMRWANHFVFFSPSPLSTYKMQLCISSTSQNWMLCNPDDKLQSNSYTIIICWKKNRPRSIQDGVLLSTVSSWCQSTQKLSKGDWCPVR